MNQPAQQIEPSKPAANNWKQIATMIGIAAAAAAGGGYFVGGEGESAAPVQKTEVSQPADPLVERIDAIEKMLTETKEQEASNKDPLAVKLVAPKAVVAGSMVDIIANVVGTADSFHFEIVPPVDGLRPTPDPSHMSFASDEDGDYILFVSVSGPNGEVASDWRALTLTPNTFDVPVPVPVQVNAEGEPVEPDEPAGPPVPQVTPQRLELADTGMTDFARAIEKLIVQVQSPSMAADVPKVATAFRMAVNAAMSGQLNDQTHYQYVVEYATSQLGDAAAAWEPFFTGVDKLLGSLEALGLISDNETACLALSDAATVLERAGPY